MTRWFYLAAAVTALAFAASLYAYFGMYDQLPERIPVHWGIDGTPDKWVDKDHAWINFWLVPGMMTAFLGLTLVLPWLSPKSFEVDRFRDTYGYVMALVNCLFAYIHAVILWSSFHPESMNVKWFITGIMVFFALMGNVMGQVRRNFWMGIRTPWTLASENVWNQTHRLAGWLWFIFGLAGAMAALAGVPPLWCFVGVLVAALFPVVYSLVLYKHLEKQGRL
jgi:uncharacterized membrane protein